MSRVGGGALALEGANLSFGSGGSKGARGTRPPGSKFFQFHAVFGKIWQNCILAPQRRVGAPPPPTWGKSWIRHCLVSGYVCIGGSKGRDGRAPTPSPVSKFFQFHAVFEKFLQNLMLAPPPESWCPHL